jgi:peptidoglycan/LPS O-acetylase OafA/YrhL
MVTGLLVLPIKDTVAALATILVIQYLPSFTNRVLKFLGNISYSIYLIHIVTGSALINLLSHKFRAGYQKPLVFIAGYLFTIACSYMFYLVIEKNSQKLSSRIAYKKPAPSLAMETTMEQVVDVK